MEAGKKRERGRTWEIKIKKRKHGGIVPSKVERMEAKRKTAWKRKIKRVEGKEQIKVYLLIAGERHWKTEPVHKAVRWKPEKIIKEKSSEYTGHWRDQKITKRRDRETKEWVISIKTNVSRPGAKEIRDIGI